MAWPGYIVYDGVEIISTPRSGAYGERASWLYPVYDNDYLVTLLGDGPYSTPALDPAPWYDPDDLRSGNFWGIYPISIDGLEDSSRGSTVTEFTTDGGNPGRLRRPPRLF